MKTQKSLETLRSLKNLRDLRDLRDLLPRGFESLRLWSIALLTVSVFALTSANANAQETIEGELQFLKAKNGETFLAINSKKKLVTKGDDGKLLESKLIQIAGLDETNWRGALKLVGKNVAATGRPMGALTQHHFTPVLIITNKVIEQNKPVLEDNGIEEPRKQAPQSEDQSTQTGSNHSQEW